MIDLENYKKFILDFIPNLKDNELYNAINHIKELDDGLSIITVRGIQFYYSTFTFSLDHIDYSNNPPLNVGVGLFVNKQLDEKIKNKGYEFR